MSDIWMQTANGRKFDLLEPTPEMVYPDDIIAHLPLIPCFTGAQKAGKFEYAYSTAQHCYHVSKFIMNYAPEYALDALLHDAWKYVIGDLTRPLNQVLNLISDSRWNGIRMNIQQAVALRFNLNFPLPDVVENIDRLARATELRDIMANVPELWSIELPEPSSEIITPWHPEAVRSTFKNRWTKLAGKAFNEL